MARRTHDKSWQTFDRGPPEDMRFLTVESLGPKRELMKNGWLVCYDVPIARTGWMLYGPGQVPVAPSPTQMAIYVQRTEDELFRPETIASFMGVGLVNDHPDPRRHPDGVTATNAQELVGGFLTNVRRGKAEDGDGDVVIGDVVVTRQDFIDAIQSGKREISAGYDADYTTIRPGIGSQTQIVANHIALVDKGRCGPRCAIGDQSTQELYMPAPQEEKGRRRLSASDLDAIDALVKNERRHLTLDDGEDQGVHVHVHMGSEGPTTGQTHDGDDKGGEKDDKYDDLKKTVDQLAGTVTTLAESMKSMQTDRKTRDAEKDPDDDEEEMDDKGEGSTATKDKKTKDAATKTEDSAALGTSFQEVMSKAEILVPGIQVPTFDAALPRAKTMDAMCGLRKKALSEFAKTEGGLSIVSGIVGDQKLDELDCVSTAVLFNAAAATKATANNTRATQDASHVPNHAVKQATVDASTLNAAHRKYWANMASGKRA